MVRIAVTVPLRFGIYRPQAEFSGGRFDGKSGVP